MIGLRAARGLCALKHSSLLKQVGKTNRTNALCLSSHFTTTNLNQSEKLELNIDATAVTRLKTILDTGEFLRVFVEGGGCSGYQYKFEVDSCLEEEEDITFIKEGVKVVCDEVS